jgi:hypothetical protein
MAKSGAVTLADIEAAGEDMLVLACDPCARTGRYAVARLIETHGRVAGLPDLRAYLSRDCQAGPSATARRCNALFRRSSQ